jgi:tripartite ATP-independent transporter DctM subunit
MILLIMLAVMLITIFLGVPVGFSIGLSSIFVLWLNGMPFSIFIQNFAMGMNSFSLLAIPFFILAGKLMNTSGITERIFTSVTDFVGHFRGGLAQVNIVSSLIFAGMSGSATADAAGLGMVEIKAMDNAGYDRDFSVAVTAASSTIGPIIPPSIIMVIYATAAQESVGKLLIGGIVPGILMTVALMLITFFIARKRDYPREQKTSFSKKFDSFVKAIPAMLGPVILVVGILSGVFTATEAGSVIVLYSFILGFFIYKELTLKQLWQIFLETMVTTANIMLIIGSAKAFGWILSYYNVPAMVATGLMTLSQNPTIITLLLVAMFLFLGCIMEAAAIVIMTVPVVLPIITQLGINPIAFGVIVAVCMSIGTLTPPLGIVMYVLCDIADLSIGKYIKALMPYLITLLVVILILVLFPGLITWLPDKFMG